jgi:hypothetical protein
MLSTLADIDRAVSIPLVSWSALIALACSAEQSLFIMPSFAIVSARAPVLVIAVIQKAAQSASAGNNLIV